MDEHGIQMERGNILCLCRWHALLSANRTERISWYRSFVLSVQYKKNPSDWNKRKKSQKTICKPNEQRKRMKYKWKIKEV